MDYIYKEGTIERDQEEAVYDLAFRSENLFCLRTRLIKENLISKDEAEVLEKVQSALITLMIYYAGAIDILDRLIEYTDELTKP